MGKREIETVRKIYGFNWASVGSREVGFEELEAIVSPDFESVMSPETGGRTLRGTEELRQFGDALEQDFEAFAYNPGEFIEAPDGRVLVLGKVGGVGRASKLPLAGEFGHLWTLEDGRATRVEAYLDPELARTKADLEGTAS